MDVALHSRHDDPAPGAGVCLALFFLLDERHQPGNRLLHDPGALDYLGQEHPAGAEQVADNVHALHQRSFDDLQRPVVLLPGLLGIGFDPGVYAFHQGVDQAFLDAAPAPGLFILLFPVALSLLDRPGELHQPVGGIRPPVEQYVFHPFQQVGLDLVVNAQLPGIDDGHIHARLYRVVQERGVHGLAHRVVAPERERYVAQAAADQRPRQVLLDQAGGLEKRDCIIVVLLHAGGDGEDIGVDDDVFRREADLVRQDAVRALRHLEAPLGSVRLALFIETHDHDRGAVAPDQARLLPEGFLAFLQADGIDHALALHAAQAGLDDGPARGIDHDGDPADIRFAGDKQQEIPHQLPGIQQPLVHAHVDELGAVLHLLAGDFQGLIELVFLDEFQEPGRAGHVGAFTDIDEVGRRGDGQRLQTTQAALGRSSGDDSWRPAAYLVVDTADMIGSGAAAAADDIDEAAGGKLLEYIGHVFGCFVVFAELVRQPGVGVYARVRARYIRKLLNILS